MVTTRGPGQRAGLTHAGIIRAARALLSEGDHELLSLRAVARRLGVAPNALYSHVPSKTALLDDVLDDVLASVVAPDPDLDDPTAGLHAVMASTYAILEAHPDLVPLYQARQGVRGPNAVRLGHVMDALLSRAGVDPAAIPQARRVLIIHTIGSAAFATASRDGEGQRVPADDVRRSFSKSLQWLLDGIVASHGAGLASP